MVSCGYRSEPGLDATVSNEDQFQSEPDGPSYVWEMFKRPFNLNIGLTAVAAAAFLAIPFGAAGVALPLLVLGAGEAIAAMFIPASASFRVKIDREYAARARAETSAHLCAEIRRRVGADDARWGIYERLCERIDSLREMARHRRSGLNDRDLRKLRHVTQEEVARRLGGRQVYISRLERRADMKLSTLKSYVEAIGGELQLMVTFPEGTEVQLKQLGGDEKEGKATVKG